MMGPCCYCNEETPGKRDYHPRCRRVYMEGRKDAFKDWEKWLKQITAIRRPRL